MKIATVKEVGAKAFDMEVNKYLDWGYKIEKLDVDHANNYSWLIAFLVKEG